MSTTEKDARAKSPTVEARRVQSSSPGQPWVAPAPVGSHRSVQFAAQLVSVAVIIAALYFGQELLVPLALALLLGFVLDPLVVRLKRIGVPQVVAVVCVVATVLALIALAAFLLAGQVRTLVTELPAYEKNLKTKLEGLHHRMSSPGAIEGAVKALDAVKKELASSAGALDAAPSASHAQVVRVEQPPPSGLDRALSLLSSLGGPLARTGVVFVFLVFVLLDRQELRDRFLRLFGANLHRTTEAMDEAGRRISRYLTMQLVVNASYGVPMGVGLWLIGVPGAPVWGVLAALMRFVPYVGALLSAVFPLSLAFAVDPGWGMLVWTAVLIGSLELGSNNVIEPWLYGASTGISAMSLIVAATFWAMLWGPIGLVMSTPLTVCLLVGGRHLPGLGFLNVLLSSQPVLEPPTRLYQRLIAGDVEEALEMAEELSVEGTAATFYDEVGIPALRLATVDHRGESNVELRHRFVQGMRTVVDELQYGKPELAQVESAQVVCIGAKFEVDALGAAMLAQSLCLAGVPAAAVDVDLFQEESWGELASHGPRIVCVSTFSETAQAQARYLGRRLRRRWPDVKLVLALWNAPAALLGADSHKALAADAVATSIKEAVAHVEQLLEQHRPDSFERAAVPDADAQRVGALQASGLLAGQARPSLDLAARRAAEIFEMPLAMVTLIDEKQQHVGGASGALSPVGENGGEVKGQDFSMPRELSLCGHAVANGETLVVEDVARDPRFANNAALRDKGVRFYAGAPLRNPEGLVFGALCLMDTEPRTLEVRELRLLESMAAELMTELHAEAKKAS